MDDDDARVVAAYGQAARRCKEGGLDGVETLGNSHLIGQFLSPATNKRTDSYGGFGEPLPFRFDGLRGNRRQAGDDFLVGFRCAVDEAMAEGLSQGECIEIAHVRALRFIDFSTQLWAHGYVAGPRRRLCPGWHRRLPMAEIRWRLRREVNLPVSMLRACRSCDRPVRQRRAFGYGAMTRAYR